MDKATAVGHIPSGLFIVASQNSDVRDGYLASWIQQVSFDPMLVSLAIKPGRPAYDLIKEKNAFCINVVGDHDKNFLKHFWKGYDPNNNPWDELPSRQGEHGGLILESAKSSIECRLIEAIQPGDHEIVIAEVLASYVHSEEAKPMTHIRKSGKDY
jgi:flavin reductase (DIM6/NTAB) family NADH-FMN oxidoreductase RutF